MISRFIEAQAPVYSSVVEELSTGLKETHWSWFIFPQIAGLGNSDIAKHYAIKDIDEAIEYLNTPILLDRLTECLNLLLQHNKDIEDILGFPDNLKLKSSMTLFMIADPSNIIFKQVLDKFFDGDIDTKTLNLLGC